MNVGVIGVGIQGQRHARIYSELKLVDNLYIYDVNEKLKTKVASDYCATSTESVKDLLNYCDSVSICVPTEYHYEITMKAIEAGANILVEKPITDKIEEAKSLVESVEYDNIITGVGHIERFNPIVNEIQKLINNPKFCEINRHNPSSDRITNTNVVKDLMIHDIDVFINVLFTTFDYNMVSYGNKDVCVSLFNIENNDVKFPAIISASRLSAKKIRSIHIEDENYTIYGDYMNQDIFIFKKPDRYSITDNRYIQENIIEKVSLGKIEPLRIELTKFLDCCLTGEEFPVTFKEATENLRICNLIEGSACIK